MAYMLRPFQLQTGNTNGQNFLNTRNDLYRVLSFGAGIQVKFTKFRYRTIKITLECSRKRVFVLIVDLV